MKIAALLFIVIFLILLSFLSIPNSEIKIFDNYYAIKNGKIASKSSVDCKNSKNPYIVSFFICK